MNEEVRARRKNDVTAVVALVTDGVESPRLMVEVNVPYKVPFGIPEERPAKVAFPNMGPLSVSDAKVFEVLFATAVRIADGTDPLPEWYTPDEVPVEDIGSLRDRVAR